MRWATCVADETFGPFDLPIVGVVGREDVPEGPLRPGAERICPMEAFLLSTAVIFVAELGDKSQLMAMTFATRFRARDVLIGITAATAIVHLASVAIGALLGSVLADYQMWISIAAGVAFFAFALWTLRGDELTEAEASKAKAATGSAILAVGAAFFLAELGDKTMLATITLATQEGWFGTWIGSTVGMVAADALAIGVGMLLGKHLPEKTIKYGAAVLFALFGMLLIAQGVGWL